MSVISVISICSVDCAGFIVASLVSVFGVVSSLSLSLSCYLYCYVVVYVITPLISVIRCRLCCPLFRFASLALQSQSLSSAIYINTFVNTVDPA